MALVLHIAAVDDLHQGEPRRSYEVVTDTDQFWLNNLNSVVGTIVAHIGELADGLQLEIRFATSDHISLEKGNDGHLSVTVKIFCLPISLKRKPGKMGSVTFFSMLKLSIDDDYFKQW